MLRSSLRLRGALSCQFHQCRQVWLSFQPCAARGLRDFKSSAATSGLPSPAAADDEDDGDDAPPVVGKAVRVERLLANLGYGKRKECQQLVRKARATTRAGDKLKVGDKVQHDQILLDGEELDPAWPLVVAVHKPVGYVVTAPDDEKILDPKVYDLLPYRYGRRRPFLSCVGRLDKDTSGLILLTDDGTLLHKINSPKKGIWKVYEATLADPVSPKDAEAAARRFASGALLLTGDFTPLLPAKLTMVDERLARVAICEGRYHQVRRMFASMGHDVISLRRISIGGLSLADLQDSEWRHLSAHEVATVFSGPTTEDILSAGNRADPAATTSSHGVASSSDSASSGGSSSSSTATGAQHEQARGSSTAGSSSSGERKTHAGIAPAAEDDSSDEEGGTDSDVDLVETDKRPFRRRRPPSKTMKHVNSVVSEEEEIKEVVLSFTGGPVKKYKDSGRWQRRREALKQILPTAL